MQDMKRSRLIAVGLAVLLAPFPSRAAAQELDVQPGERVRVTLAGASPTGESGPRLVGRISEVGAGTLRLDAASSDDRVVPREAIVRLERSARPSRKPRGALIGFGIGFATLFTLGTIASEGDCFRGDDCLVGMIAGSAILALPAAAVGAIVSPGEEWADVTPRGSSHPATGDARVEGDGLEIRVVPLVGGRTGVALVGSF